jgi:AP2-like factor (euAP2 lineage)
VSSAKARYIGVSWHKASSSWKAHLYDPQTKRSQHVGYYASEEDAARAYDCAAVQAHGPGAERNFPGEDISELPEAVGGERRQRSSSRYVGVSRNNSSCVAQLYDPQSKRIGYIGSYTSEEAAARAYDCAAVQAHGPDAERNFSGVAICELSLTICPSQPN